MDIDEKVVEALAVELQRQGEASDGPLEVQTDDERCAILRGRVDLEALATVAAGALASGP